MKFYCYCVLWLIYNCYVSWVYSVDRIIVSQSANSFLKKVLILIQLFKNSTLSQLSHGEAILFLCNTLHLLLFVIIHFAYYSHLCRMAIIQKISGNLIHWGLRSQVCSKYCLVNYKYFYVKLVLSLACNWSSFYFYTILSFTAKTRAFYVSIHSLIRYSWVLTICQACF